MLMMAQERRTLGSFCRTHSLMRHVSRPFQIVVLMGLGWETAILIVETERYKSVVCLWWEEILLLLTEK